MACDELLRLRISRRSDPGRGFLQVIAGMTQLGGRFQQEPIGSRLAKGHSNAARVHDLGLADRPIELHVGMATNHQGSIRFGKDKRQPILGR